MNKIGELIQERIYSKPHHRVQHDFYQLEAVLIVLDELSEELLTLAGKGLPIVGERRLRKALGLPPEEALLENEDKTV